MIVCVFEPSIKKETSNFHFVFLDIQAWSPEQPCKKSTVSGSHPARKPRSHGDAVSTYAHQQPGPESEDAPRSFQPLAVESYLMFASPFLKSQRS